MHRHLIPFALLLAACGSAPKDSRTARDNERYAEAVKKNLILIGMKESEVRASWGKPSKKDRVRRGRYTRDRWLYPSSAIYFDDDGYVVDMEGPTIG
ncbi:MAG: hypothetical protein ACYTGN_18445 [Planctomycetota bacterium]|jgi:hypothetical protein